jgi:ABC-type antimicrobial peptide transport system permease subunit
VIFFPIDQSYNSTSVIVARASPGGTRSAALIGRVVQRLDPRLPLSLEQGVPEALALGFLPSQIAVTALGIFGALAVALAIAGIYGSAACSVSARLRELGIRLAVGASPWQALRSVLRRVAGLLAVGSIAGIALGTAAQGLLEAVVYQASARDPLLLIGVAGAMVAVGLVAAWAPAHRALRVDPSQTLRAE